MTNNEDFDEEKYARAMSWQTQIFVEYCPGCHEIRAESEMIENMPCCVHCCDE